MVASNARKPPPRGASRCCCCDEYRRLLRCLLDCDGAGREPPRPRCTLTFGGYTVTFYGDFEMSLSVDGGPVTAKVKFTDAHGNAAPVDGVPVWTNDREDVATMVVDADGMSAVFTPTGLAGAAMVSCTGDADLGSGMEEVVLTGLMDLTGGKATGGEITFTQGT